MKIKTFVAGEIQYFEIRIFSFNSYVYYLTRCFIVSTRAFNLLTRAFNLSTRAFNPLARAFNLPTRAFNLATRAFNLANRAFSLLTCRFELVTRGFEVATPNSCFTFPLVECPSKKNFLFIFAMFAYFLHIWPI